jgi:hypothetical protein
MRVGPEGSGKSFIRRVSGPVKRAARAAFPGSGISGNLTNKARKMGIALWRFGRESGA